MIPKHLIDMGNRPKDLVFDISNVLYRTYFAAAKKEAETAAGMALHTAFTTLNKYFKQEQPDRVVMAFDRSSWRKVYTASDDCVSKLKYKGTRRQDMTPRERQQFMEFLAHLKEFEQMIRDFTKIIPLAADGLEADDLMSGWVESHPEHDQVIITTDSDMSQLLRMSHVRIVSPATNKDDATLEKFDNNPDYYLFQKCVRGDKTDNVQSAYPGVRETRIKKAYTDPYEFEQMMDVTWKNHDGRIMSVRELYQENRLLIDLSRQPDEIKEKIAETIFEAETAKRKYQHFKVLKFCGKHDLKRIVEGIDNYIPMLNA